MDDEHEQLAEGHRVIRDEDTGQFTHSELDPERAREIGRRGGLLGLKENRRDAAELADALVEAATGGPAEREKARSLLLRALAPVIAKGGTGSVQAIEAAARAIGEAFGVARPPQPGDRCRLCGRDEKAAVELVVNGPAVESLALLLFSTSDDERVAGLAARLVAVTRERDGLVSRLDSLVVVRGNGSEI